MHETGFEPGSVSPQRNMITTRPTHFLDYVLQNQIFKPTKPIITFKNYINLRKKMSFTHVHSQNPNPNCVIPQFQGSANPYSLLH